MRIIIVNVNWIGDILFSTLSIRCLRKKFPDAYIAVLLPQNTAELLKNNPYLDEIILFNPLSERKFPYCDFGLVKELRCRKFDCSIHLHRSFTRRFCAYLSGIERRIGYNEKYRGFLLTDKVASQRDKIHRAEYYFNLAKVLEAEDDGLGLNLFLEQEELEAMRSFLERQNIKKFCLIHIGANWQAKKWPLEYWAKFIDLIKNRYDIDIIISGTESDKTEAEAISRLTNSEVLILTGRTALRELISLIKLSAVFVGTDTAPLHIAAALSTPAVGIYGPTSPDITGPFRPAGKIVLLKEDLKCAIPCYKTVCGLKYECMRRVTAQKAADAINSILAS